MIPRQEEEERPRGEGNGAREERKGKKYKPSNADDATIAEKDINSGKIVVKEVKKMAEDGKVAVRSIRRDAIEKLKALKKSNEITEDDQNNAEKKIQTLTDKFCKEVDDTTVLKEKEIMEI